MADASPVTFPTEIEVTLKLKMIVNNPDQASYYTAHDNAVVISDMYDMLSDSTVGQLISINGLTTEDAKKKLQAIE
jgi:Zn-dependent M28 family amino/carboxypeptidase